MRLIFKNSKIKLIFFILLVLAIFYGIESQEVFLRASLVQSASPTSTETVSHHIDSAPLSALTNNNNPPTQNVNPIVLEHEIAEWDQQHGLSSDDAEILITYKSFDLATLTSIAEAGDPNAIYELGERMLDSQGSRAAYDYLLDIAAKGYVNIYPLLANAKKAELQNADSDETRHQLALEILSIYKMGSQRGLQIQSALNADDFVNEGEIKLTPDDFQKIDALQQELQRTLINRQNELGLTGFEPIPMSVVNSQQNILNKLSISKVY